MKDLLGMTLLPWQIKVAGAALRGDTIQNTLHQQ